MYVRLTNINQITRGVELTVTILYSPPMIVRIREA